MHSPVRCPARGLLLFAGRQNRLQLLLPSFLPVAVGVARDLFRLVDRSLLQTLAAVVHGAERGGGSGGSGEGYILNLAEQAPWLLEAARG